MIEFIANDFLEDRYDKIYDIPASQFSLSPARMKYGQESGKVRCNYDSSCSDRGRS